MWLLRLAPVSKPAGVAVDACGEFVGVVVEALPELLDKVNF
jgi:hypothetical protein